MSGFAIIIIGIAFAVVAIYIYVVFGYVSCRIVVNALCGIVAAHVHISTAHFPPNGF